MARAFNQDWGYAIDYDKEIANDLREIEQTERHLPLVASLTEAERSGPWYQLDIGSFLVADLARATLLGMTEQEATDLLEFLELTPADAPEPERGWYLRGSATWKRTGAMFGSHVIRDPKTLLKKLRARLARHRRNQKRFG
jgi:hypothetical protein